MRGPHYKHTMPFHWCRQPRLFCRIVTSLANALTIYKVDGVHKQARDEKCRQYEEERDRKERLREDENNEDMTNGTPQFMAARKEGQHLPEMVEYADLFELDDPALEAELRLLEEPISESPRELRRLQQSGHQRRSCDA